MSWHGTTIQVVQPLALNVQGINPAIEDKEDSNTEVVLPDVNASFCSADSDTSSSVDGLMHQKHTKRPTPESSPRITTRSPEYKKVSRRSRSFTESTSAAPPTHSLGQYSRALFLPPNPSINQPLSHLSYNHYTPLKSNHYLQEFYPTEKESRELSQLQNMALHFITLR